MEYNGIRNEHIEKVVVIPDSVTEIGEYAFWGCEKIVIKAPKNSYAHK